MKALSAKQHLFVSEYARWRNGSKAARNAGYNPDSAGQKAWTLLNDRKYAHVQAAVRKALDDVDEQHRMQHQAMVDVCMQTMDFDVGDLKSKDGSWKDFDDLDPEVRKQITSISENEYESDGQKGRSLTLKFGNKLEAVKVLGKHNGFFIDRAAPGENAAYSQARENLTRMFDRIRHRAAEPAPGQSDPGGAS